MEKIRVLYFNSRNCLRRNQAIPLSKQHVGSSPFAAREVFMRHSCGGGVVCADSTPRDKLNQHRSGGTSQAFHPVGDSHPAALLPPDRSDVLWLRKERHSPVIKPRRLRYAPLNGHCRSV
jgi:hypothetical protein